MVVGSLESKVAVQYVLQFSRGDAMDWKTMLAYITGTVDQTSSIFTTNEITKGRAICCCSRPAKRRTEWKGRFAVGNGSADS